MEVCFSSRVFFLFPRPRNSLVALASPREFFEFLGARAREDRREESLFSSRAFQLAQYYSSRFFCRFAFFSFFRHRKNWKEIRNRNDSSNKHVQPLHVHIQNLALPPAWPSSSRLTLRGSSPLHGLLYVVNPGILKCFLLITL